MLRRCAVLLLAAALLAGCGGRDRDQPAPPAAPATQPSLPVATTLVSSLPRYMGTSDGYQIFEVSAQQYAIIGDRVPEVLIRQKLWDQGVRFGANHDPDRNMYFVLIKPGLSSLTARQILGRLLGTP